jgi:hypothetical protein
MTELFAMAVWAAYAARIAFWSQAFKLTPVMKKLRQGVWPAALLVAGFAPLSQAHSMPGQLLPGGSSLEPARIVETRRDGISLDEAVSRAEAQYRAKVVRTDVQDEDGRRVYVLKLLSDSGRVFTVRIDASTGRMR